MTKKYQRIRKESGGLVVGMFVGDKIKITIDDKVLAITFTGKSGADRYSVSLNGDKAFNFDMSECLGFTKKVNHENK